MDAEQVDPQAAQIGGTVPLTAVMDALKNGTLTNQAVEIIKLAQTEDGRQRLNEAAPSATQTLNDKNSAFLNAVDAVEKHKRKVKDEEGAHHNKEQKLRKELTTVETQLKTLNDEWGANLDQRKQEVETNDKTDKILAACPGRRRAFPGTRRVCPGGCAGRDKGERRASGLPRRLARVR